MATSPRPGMTPGEPQFRTIHGSHFEAISDFWFVVTDSARNTFRLNALPWNRIAVVTFFAMILSAAVDWYIPGPQYAFDVSATTVTGLLAIIVYMVRAALSDPAAGPEAAKSPSGHMRGGSSTRAA